MADQTPRPVQYARSDRRVLNCRQCGGFIGVVAGDASVRSPCVIHHQRRRLVVECVCGYRNIINYS